MRYAQSYEERRSFGEALRKRRLSKHLSQAALGEIIGIAGNTISQYEANGMSFSFLTALNIVDALEWSMAEWEVDANAIYKDNSWRRVARRGKREHADDYRT